MCAKTMTLGNFAKWVDALMHIHISAMGMSVNVKVDSQLTYLHIANLLFYNLRKKEYNLFINFERGVKGVVCTVLVQV